MRKTTIMWLVLAAISGGILFHTSQKVTDGRVRLATLAQDVREEEETIRVLNAEWSYLNQPARLEKLANQYLPLKPLTGKQMIKISDLPARAAPPAPTDIASAGAPATAANTQPQQIAATPVSAVNAAPVAKPVQTESFKPAAALPKPAPKPAPRPEAKPVLTAEVKTTDGKTTAAKPAAAHKPASPAATHAAEDDARSFGDVMKSLGVGHRGGY